MTSQNVSFSLAPFLPVKAGTINDAIFTMDVPSPLNNKRFYTTVTLFFQRIENLKIDMNHGPNSKIIDLGDQDKSRRWYSFPQNKNKYPH